MYTDQTGCFSTTSYCGMQYVMVLYEPTESNAILVEPMRNRTSGKMLATYLTLVNRLKKTGIEPTLHILDNECSNEFKEAIRKTLKISNLCHHMITDRTLQKKQSRYLKITLYLCYVVLTQCSKFACGAGSYVSQNTS